jgi:hypothetical protein
MQIFFGTLAVLGFVAAFGVHVAALLGLPIQDRVPQVWALHVGIFVVFIPAVFYLKKDTAANDPLALFRGTPPWTVVALLALFLYAFINFFVSLSATGGATPDIRDGQYVLHRKGQVVRQLSEAEYSAGRAAEVRLFSGHWLLFYAMPAAVFLVRRRHSEA